MFDERETRRATQKSIRRKVLLKRPHVMEASRSSRGANALLMHLKPVPRVGTHADHPAHDASPRLHVLSQGEDGDHFYLVDSGTYEVYLKQSEDSKPVATYEAGKSFGELALLHRSALMKIAVGWRPMARLRGLQRGSCPRGLDLSRNSIGLCS